MCVAFYSNFNASMIQEYWRWKCMASLGGSERRTTLETAQRIQEVEKATAVYSLHLLVDKIYM